jgi:hypothetical protein
MLRYPLGRANEAKISSSARTVIISSRAKAASGGSSEAFRMIRRLAGADP